MRPFDIDGLEVQVPIWVNNSEKISVISQDSIVAYLLGSAARLCLAV